MVNLRGDLEARSTLTRARERNRDLENQVRALRSSTQKQRRDAYGPDTIPDTAVQSAAAPGLVSLKSTGFGLTTSPAVVLAGQVTVPPRMSRCALALTGRVWALNNTLMQDNLHAAAYVRVGQDPAWVGNDMPRPVAANTAGTNIATVAALPENLVPGTVIDVAVMAWVQLGAWTANANNLCDLTGSLGWST